MSALRSVTATCKSPHELPSETLNDIERKHVSEINIFDQPEESLYSRFDIFQMRPQSLSFR
jgi:hypothetical protein